MNKRTGECIRKYGQELILRYPLLEEADNDFTKAAELLEEVFRKGGKVLVCGNGGSSADADHIVGELMKGFILPRPLPLKIRKQLSLVDPERGGRIAVQLQQGLPAVSLGSQTSLISAFMNDVEPDLVFAQQVAGYGRPGDLLWGISTSGNASNVINAAVAARAMGMKVLGLTGHSGGFLKSFTDACLCVPETETYRVQELHLPVYHALCLALEEIFFGEGT